MQKRLLDLRFVIGLFFTIIGLLLLVYSFFATTQLETGESINRYTGLVLLAFGVFMIILSQRKEGYDELVEEPPRD
ncbi:hypothetical protein [Flavisolibacter tropicus]|uniref:Uncharacterized protein n=1 Tax=Flavisolibacter tropicus TaxID=1492898 RepID=A0A172TRJ4_9BACT|nr:hypothetical protein [Flavisolibacter tropicus]ANE49602.1 hypothetical protein SY85_02865 [Flavisolibacter tropicus]